MNMTRILYIKRWVRQILSSILAGASILAAANVGFWTSAQAAPQNNMATEIIVLGDSLTAGYGLPPQAGFVPQLEQALRAKAYQVRLINAGVSGDTSTGGRIRMDWSVPDKSDRPQAAIVALGANDALRGIDPQLTKRNLAQIIGSLQKRDFAVMLVGMLAPPNMGRVYGEQFNSLYPALAKQYKLVYYPFFLDGVAAQKNLNLDDGIHPNAEGIKIIVARMLPMVEKLLAQMKN